MGQQPLESMDRDTANPQRPANMQNSTGQIWIQRALFVLRGSTPSMPVME
jgi:hypothetical protein